MSSALSFDPIRLPPECEGLRQEVRAFLAEEIAAGTYDPDEPGTVKRVHRASARSHHANYDWALRGWATQLLIRMRESGQ